MPPIVTIDGFEVEVFGAQGQAFEQHFHLIDGAYADTRFADLSEDIQSSLWISTIQRRRIEGRASIEWLAFGKEMESLVCSLSATLSCEHSQRNFIFALEWEYSSQ